MTDPETQAKIDAALDAALDDLDDSDEEEEEQFADARQSPDEITETAPKNSVEDPPPATSTATNSAATAQSDTQPPVVDQMDHLMQQLLQGGGDGEDEMLGHFLQAMQSQLGQLQNLETGPKTPRPSTVVPPPPTTTGNTDADIDQTLNSLFENLQQQAKDTTTNTSTNNNNNSTETTSELDMLQEMMQQLGTTIGNDNDDGNTDGADALIDGMMQQLLSKELMYEPMKSVTEKFPQWLEDHKDKLPPTQYTSRCQQYKCFQKLVHAYDTEPDNTPLLMKLMQDVQEFGQPPVEIVQDIAPGLEFDAEGVPKMESAMPPFLAGDEECRIM
ncbi:Peroxisome biogenesis protein 19 [Seminavis robusta]|uniref:Peroxisome biogenesis protein 19 n=1 Tax=Seminavis robusta TaxID=568900 RepID=A0A9N8D8W5_9STRA|nr:Peroxisome biogenesis protein 19 [Seminavis robusta]|eukprot:Sro44_g026600.1 Peroxisome biogenesis protein 19 (330) ;mRNA; f:57212-58330